MMAVVFAVLFAVQTPAGAGADLEGRARQIEGKVIAPCCWSQQVSVHSSPAATEMKTDIRRRLSAGETEQVILAAYVAQYGDRILAEPPAKGFNVLLYAIPPILSIAGIGVLILVIRRFTRRAAATPALAVAGGTPASASTYDTRLDDELRDMD
jgi:cytochrome c-type biogenesis protein CcmH